MERGNFFKTLLAGRVYKEGKPIFSRAKRRKETILTPSRRYRWTHRVLNERQDTDED